MFPAYCYLSSCILPSNRLNPYLPLCFLSSSRVEAAPALPAPRQQRPHPSSVRSPSPARSNPRRQTLQSPNLRPQLPVLPSPNLSLPRPPLTMPPRTPQLHLVPQQHLVQTGIHRPPRSQPGPQGAMTPGRRRRSGQRAWQSEFLKMLTI